MVEVISEQYERNNVTVVLEWPNEGGGVAYSASVTPENPLMAEMLAGNGTRGIKLVLLYNRQYNVSTVATLCGVNNTTSITELNYGKDYNYYYYCIINNGGSTNFPKTVISRSSKSRQVDS